MSTVDYVRGLRQVIGTQCVNLVGAAGLVLDGGGALLLGRKRGQERWSLPGGICELGESFEAALHRELREETSLRVLAAELLDVISGPHTFKAIRGGDQFYMYTALYRVRAWQGTPTPDGQELEELRFFPPTTLPPLSGPVGRRAVEWLLTA